MPQRGPQRLFLATVPRRVEHQHARQQRRLEDAQQDSDDRETRKVVARGHQADAGAPEHEARADVPADRHLGHDPEAGELHRQVSKVEDAAEPGVLLSLEVGVLPQSENGGEAHCILKTYGEQVSHEMYC